MPNAGLVWRMASSTASPSMTDGVALMSRTLFLLSPSARFFASKALMWPRCRALTLAWPNAGRLCNLRFLGVAFQRPRLDAGPDLLQPTVRVGIDRDVAVLRRRHRLLRLLDDLGA